MARTATGQVIERRGKRGRSFALRFRAYGQRHYVSLGRSQNGWTRRRAEEELANVLADVRRGIWRAESTEPEGEPRPEPTFHEFASELLASRRHELAPRTIEDWEWALSYHLLPFFARLRLSEITVELVDRYRAAKVRERELGLVERPLSNNSINKTLSRLAQVLEVAVEYDYLAANPAKGRRRRLKTEPPRRRYLETDQVRALLAAAGRHRALLATATMAGGLRVSELTALRWRDLDLSSRRLRVVRSKTAAGVREVDLPLELCEELQAHRAHSRYSAADDFIFATQEGTRRERNNVRERVLKPALRRADVALRAAGRPPIPDGVTMHSLRHSYASLLAEAGADPAYTMAQLGHRDAKFTLNVYTHVGNRRHAASSVLGRLLDGATGDDAAASDPPAAPPKGAA